MGDLHPTTPRRLSRDERLQMAAEVAQSLKPIRHCADLVPEFERACDVDVDAVSYGYRARAFGFTATATCSRQQAVCNWIVQVLTKAKGGAR